MFVLPPSQFRNQSSQMHHHYKTTVLLSFLFSPLLATGQAMKPVAANDFSFNAFKLPPFPVEVMHVAPAPGGGVTLTTFMPIAGRTLPMGETPKPKGALFPGTPDRSNASYLQTLTLGPDAKPVTSAPGAVFGQAPQPVGDVDWAVFGTNATDGPQRLPYGGDVGQMASRFPQMGMPAVLSVQPKLIDNGIGAGGKVHMAYP